MSYLKESGSRLTKNGVPEVGLITNFITASTEFEFFAKTYNCEELRDVIAYRHERESGIIRDLNTYSGFMDDFHEDGSVYNRFHSKNWTEGNESWHSVEVSTLPSYVKDFEILQEELKTRINRLTLGDRRNYRKNKQCSNHIHFTLRYNAEEGSVFSNFPARKVYGRFVKIVRKFYACFRLLGMTDPISAIRSNQYGLWNSIGNRDRLYSNRHDFSTTSGYENFNASRDSIIRSAYLNDNNFHVELRHSDGILSETLLSLNMQLIAAIFLWACDLVRENRNILIGSAHLDFNRRLLDNIIAGSYNKEDFKSQMYDLLSNIYPYLRMLGGTIPEELIEKVLECPCFMFIRNYNQKHGNSSEFDSGEVFNQYEKYLNGRNRIKDETLRYEFIKLTKVGYFVRSNTLPEYLQQVAETISIKLNKQYTAKNINSLYLMLRREGYNIAFEYGKLVILP